MSDPFANLPRGREIILSPVREHSRKPDEATGPYLELFARQPRAGWDALGNETNKFAEAAE